MLAIGDFEINHQEPMRLPTRPAVLRRHVVTEREREACDWLLEQIFQPPLGFEHFTRRCVRA